MASELRLRRGTDTEHNTFTGASSEITANTTNKSIHVHDGTTAGGYELARADLNNVSNSTFAAKASAAGISGGGGSLTATITAATQANPVVVTTDSAHGFVDGTEVSITDIVGMTNLNGNNYYIDVLTSTTFALYSDTDLTATVDGTGFTAYTSGGTAAGSASGGAPINAAYITVGSETSLPNERRLQAGNGVALTDGGAGGALVVAASYSSNAPSNLGSATAGVSNNVARSDHVHAMPTSTDVGAVPTARQVIAGSGLTGGGALSADVTLSLSADANSLTDVYVNNPANGDVLIYNDGTSRFENSQNFAKNSILKDNVTVATATINKLNFIGTGITTTVNSGDASRIDIDFGGILTTEGVQDIVGGMVSDNTESGITVTYNDTDGKLNFDVADPTITLTGNVTGAATMTNLGNVSIATTIANDSVALGTKTTGNYVKTVTAGTGITLTNTGSGLEGADQTIAIDLDGKANLAEFVADTVGGMVSGNTESGISVVYDDADNTLDFDVGDFTITLAGDLSGTATVTNLGNTTLTATIGANSVALGTDTTGAYVSTITAGAGISVTGGTGETSTPTIAVDTANATFVEAVQDLVGTMFTGNTESGITATYQDGDGTIDLDVADFTVTLAGDLAGSVTITNLADATLTATVGANAVELGTNTTGSYVQTVTAGTGISVVGGTGEASTPSISVNTANTDFVEAIQDIVGAMVQSNTETGITVSYQDGDGTLDFVAASPTITLSGDVSGSATMTNLGSVNISVTVNDDSHAHTIENIDGLRTELNSLAASSGSTSSFSDEVTFNDDITVRNILPSSNNLYKLGANASNQFLEIWSASFKGTADNAAAIGMVADNTTNATHYVPFVGGATGAQTPNSDSTFTYNPGTNTLAATNFSGTATSAKYADLAERYHADSTYAIGTIVRLGGTAEVTATTEEADTQVIGVVSENPAYLMNAGAGENATHPAIAMTGRVKVKVEGPITKGQRVISSGTPGVGKAVADADIPSMLAVVGRALESNADENIKTVECIVGKL